MADADMLHQLFTENNQLRSQHHALQRELFNKGSQLDSAEDEIRQLKLEKEDMKGAKQTTTKKTAPLLMAMGSGTRELEESIYALEHKNGEIRQLKDDMSRLQNDFDKQEKNSRSEDQLEREVARLQTNLYTLKMNKTTPEKVEPTTVKETRGEDTAVTKEITQLKKQNQELVTLNSQIKKQLLELSTDTNKKYNEQQNQLQGMEMLLDEAKRQYDEFISVTKIEHDAYKVLQSSEYDSLKAAFEAHKKEQYDEKRAMSIEHQGMLYTLQSLFDEYRKTAEFLFNAEVVKLEDELMTQALRYENEILYIAQAKDKFYSDMMVAKDAKIMSLIEGSDLQSVLQKHEMDIENIRKEYVAEIERIKSQQENEQKNLISFLQRQNTTLEGKTEKLQLHIRTMEGKIKDLISTIENKNRAIQESEEQKIQLDNQYQGLIEQEKNRVTQLMQEKEVLRHKVIRLNMQSKGEGENTIQNMLKRISRDTTELSDKYTELSTKHDVLVDDHARLQKRLKEREKWIEVLEKEIKKRNEEYTMMTRTFEGFLVSRARQTQKDRSRRLMKMHDLAATEAPVQDNPYKDLQVLSSVHRSSSAENTNTTGSPRHSTLNTTVILDSKTTAPVKGVLKATVPDANATYRATSGGLDGFASEKQDLERGHSYLRRFKTLSKAFAKGEFRKVGEPTGPSASTAAEPTGPWQNCPLYEKLEASAVLPVLAPPQTLPLRQTQLYKGSANAEWSESIQHPKPLVYQPAEKEQTSLQSSLSPLTGSSESVKLYNYEVRKAKPVVESTGIPMIGAIKGAKVLTASSPKKSGGFKSVAPLPLPQPSKSPGPPLVIGGNQSSGGR